jgi:hypothetical protein
MASLGAIIFWARLAVAKNARDRRVSKEAKDRSVPFVTRVLTIIQSATAVTWLFAAIFSDSLVVKNIKEALNDSVLLTRIVSYFEKLMRPPTNENTTKVNGITYTWGRDQHNVTEFASLCEAISQQRFFQGFAVWCGEDEMTNNNLVKWLGVSLAQFVDYPTLKQFHDRFHGHSWIPKVFRRGPHMPGSRVEEVSSGASAPANPTRNNNNNPDGLIIKEGKIYDTVSLTVRSTIGQCGELLSGALGYLGVFTPTVVNALIYAVIAIMIAHREMPIGVAIFVSIVVFCVAWLMVQKDQSILMLYDELGNPVLDENGRQVSIEIIKETKKGKNKHGRGAIKRHPKAQRPWRKIKLSPAQYEQFVEEAGEDKVLLRHLIEDAQEEIWAMENDDWSVPSEDDDRGMPDDGTYNEWENKDWPHEVNQFDENTRFVEFNARVELTLAKMADAMSTIAANLRVVESKVDNVEKKKKTVSVLTEEIVSAVKQDPKVVSVLTQAELDWIPATIAPVPVEESKSEAKLSAILDKVSNTNVQKCECGQVLDDGNRFTHPSYCPAKKERLIASSPAHDAFQLRKSVFYIQERDGDSWRPVGNAFATSKCGYTTAHEVFQKCTMPIPDKDGVVVSDLRVEYRDPTDANKVLCQFAFVLLTRTDASADDVCTFALDGKYIKYYTPEDFKSGRKDRPILQPPFVRRAITHDIPTDCSAVFSIGIDEEGGKYTWRDMNGSIVSTSPCPAGLDSVVYNLSTKAGISGAPIFFWDQKNLRFVLHAMHLQVDGLMNRGRRLTSAVIDRSFRS